MPSLVLDLSNNDRGTIDPQCFKDNGVVGVILGWQIPYQTREIAGQLGDIPIIGAYAFLWDVETSAIRVAKAIQGALETGCDIVWLDCEDGDNLPGNSSQRIAEVEAGVRAVEAAGLEAGIYTIAPFWTGAMDNTTRFSRLKLWHANFGVNDCNKPPVETVNYGGWTDVYMHQFCSEPAFCGRNHRDRNYLLGEEGMAWVSKEEFDALASKVSRIDSEVQQCQNQLWGDNAVARDANNPYVENADQTLYVFKDSRDHKHAGNADHSHPHYHKTDASTGTEVEVSTQ